MPVKPTPMTVGTSRATLSAALLRYTALLRHCHAGPDLGVVRGADTPSANPHSDARKH